MTDRNGLAAPRPHQIGGVGTGAARSREWDDYPNLVAREGLEPPTSWL